MLKGLVYILFVALVFSLAVSSYERYTNREGNTVIEFSRTLPSYIQNVLHTYPQVVSIDNNNSRTYVILNTTLIQGLNLDGWLEGVDRNLIDNYDRLQVYPDNLPPPLCLLDGLTGVKVGFYSWNYTMIRIPNDPRCP